jgi:HAD superfamily hydrolase (TIGR01484 family)
MTDTVIAFDLDGTLLDQSGAMHPRDIEILSARDSAIFIPCTGRPLHSVKRLFASNGLFVDQRLPLHLISQNGSLVYFPDERLFIQHTFPEDVQKRLLKRFQDTPDLAAYLFSANGICEMHSNALSQSFNEHWKLPFLAFNPHAEQPACTKFMLISDRDDVLEQIQAEAQRASLETSFSLDHVLELNPGGINKGVALRELISLLKLDLAHLYVAGDGGNDLPLFALSPNSFTPLNSREFVRTHASQQIDTSSEGLLAPILRYAQRTALP